MCIFFFDTSALHFKYYSDKFSTQIRRIISDHRYDCYIADVSIVEIASSFGNQCRTNKWGTEEFDQMDRRFLDDLATEQLKIRAVTKRIVMRARHLIRLAGVKNVRRISANDAVIACCCLDLALEKQKVIRFYSADVPLYSILKDIDAFRCALDFRLLQ